MTLLIQLLSSDLLLTQLQQSPQSFPPQNNE